LRTQTLIQLSIKGKDKSIQIVNGVQTQFIVSNEWSTGEMKEKFFRDRVTGMIAGDLEGRTFGLERSESKRGEPDHSKITTTQVSQLNSILSQLDQNL
jgi:hypothetical protein